MTSGVINFQYKIYFCSWKFPLANYTCSLWPFISTLKICTRDRHIESFRRKSIVWEQGRCQYCASFLVQCRHLVSQEGVELILATNTSHSCTDKVILYNYNLCECLGWSMCQHHLIVHHRHIYLTVVAYIGQLHLIVRHGHIYLTVVAYIGTEQHFKITKGANGGSHDTVMLSLKYPMVTMQIGTAMLKDNGVRDA